MSPRSFSRHNRWRRALLDPVFFAREFLEIEPHPGQACWLRNSNRPENLLHTGNRWGKSLVQAVKILHRCLFKIRDLRYDKIQKYAAVNCSITQDQAGIIFDNLLRLIKGRPLLEILVNCVRYTPYPRLYFGNGAVFSCRSTRNRGQYILGQDYDYCCFDEAAFEPEFDYVVNEVLMLRLADRAGMLDYVSTPNGKNAFYRKSLELSKRPQKAYLQQGKSEENPYISREFLVSKRRTLPELKVRQNLEGDFVETGREYISEDYVQRAFGMAKGLAKPLEGHRYLSGWDLARKFTYTVGVTLDVSLRPAQVVAFERFRGREWEEVFSAIRKRKKLYGGRVLIDSTGVGDVVLSQLADIGAEGFNFGLRGGRAKSELLANLELLHQRGDLAYPYLEQEDDDGSWWSNLNEFREASWEEGISGDFIMALALAAWNLRDGLDTAERPAPKLARI